MSRRGAGEPLDGSVRRALEPQLGADLRGVRVHRSAEDQKSAGALGAKAFTHKDDIWLGAGQSPKDLKLMGHEATHVVQQRGGPPAASRAPADATTPSSAGDVAPGFVELKGNAAFAVSPAIDAWLSSRPRGKGPVEVRYGDLARGEVVAERTSSGAVEVRKQAIGFDHPWLRDLTAALGRGAPMLVLETKGRGVAGWIGFDAKSDPLAMAREALAHAEALGLRGFKIPKPTAPPFELSGGALRLELKDIRVTLGRVFDGTFSVRLGEDRTVDFQGVVKVTVPGVAAGDLKFARDERGAITGAVSLNVDVHPNLRGEIQIAWDGHAVTGEGKIAYQGEKLSGSVTLRVAERSGAKPAAGEAGAAADAAAEGAAEKAPAGDLVLSGEGELDFRFTDWLAGKAQVTVDDKGHVTVVGEIRPQAEVELFPQRTVVKPLFKVEARAAYGIPVLGNVFVFANVGAEASAMIGPAKLRDIAVAGTYSTDPEQSKDFSVQGALTISGAAGLRLRGEAGAGIEIASHDIKAGAGINAFAGVKAYAEARPIIGYRETGEPGKDKKGEFFIRGELEMAAQPVLALDGDLFVEVDAPWWSPVPDKKWTWPLGGKEYPLGGSLGFGADVDYVIGSDSLPTVEFKPVDFSGDKFISDLFAKETKPPSGEQAARKANWKEGNSAGAEPSAAAGGDPSAAAMPGQTAKAQPAGGKVGMDQVDPAVLEAQRKNGSGTAASGPSTTKDGTGGEDPEHQKKVGIELGHLAQEFAEFGDEGASEEEVRAVTERVNRKDGAFRSFRVVDAGERFEILYEASPEDKAPGPKKKKGAGASTDPEWGGVTSGGYGKSVRVARLTKSAWGTGSPASAAPNYDRWDRLTRRTYPTGSPYFVRGHLLNHNLGGPADWTNLTPITQIANNRGGEEDSMYYGFENTVKDAVRADQKVTDFSVKAVYGNRNRKKDLKALDDALAAGGLSQKERDRLTVVRDVVDEEQYIPTHIECAAKVEDKDVKKNVENDLGDTPVTGYSVRQS